MRIDSSSQLLTLERSPRQGAATTPLRESQRAAEQRGELPGSPATSQGLESQPQPRRVVASTASSENLPARSQAFSYERPPSGRASQALASYTSTAQLGADPDAPEVLGLDLYA